MKKLFSLSVGLILLGLILFGAFWVIQQGFRSLQAMDADTRGAAIAAFAVVAVPVITFSTQYWLEKRRSREQAIREKRTAFYDQVIVVFISMLNDSKNSTPPKSGKSRTNTVAEHTRELEKLTPSMILYGSRGFVQAWNRFRAVSGAQSIQDTDDAQTKKKNLYLMLASMEVMLLEARKDLGHRVAEADRSEYVATFVNDLDRELLRQIHKEISNKTAK